MHVVWLITCGLHVHCVGISPLLVAIDLILGRNLVSRVEYGEVDYMGEV